MRKNVLYGVIFFLLIWSLPLLSQTLSEKLEELQSLRATGAITESEFSELRQKLLSSFARTDNATGIRSGQRVEASYGSRPEYLILAVKVHNRATHIVKMPDTITLNCNNRELTSQKVSNENNNFIMAFSLEGLGTGKYDFLGNLKTQIRKKKGDEYTPWEAKSYSLMIPVDLRGSENPQRIIEFIENKGFFETTPDYKLLSREEYMSLIEKRKQKEEDKKSQDDILKTLRQFSENARKK